MKGRPKLKDQCQVYQRAHSQAYQVDKCRCDGCVAWQKSRKRGKWDPVKKKKAFDKWYAKPESKVTILNAFYRRYNKTSLWMENWTPDNHAAWEALVAKRDRLTAETGEDHHIDHIVPLAAGGPHHPANCRVITAQENLRRPKDGSDL